MRLFWGIWKGPLHWLEGCRGSAMQWVKAGFANRWIVEPPKGMWMVLWGKLFGEWPTQHIPVNLKTDQMFALFTLVRRFQWPWAQHQPLYLDFTCLAAINPFTFCSCPKNIYFTLLHILSPLSVEEVVAFLQQVQIFPQEKMEGKLPTSPQNGSQACFSRETQSFLELTDVCIFIRLSFLWMCGMYVHVYVMVSKLYLIIPELFRIQKVSEKN